MCIIYKRFYALCSQKYLLSHANDITSILRKLTGLKKYVHGPNAAFTWTTLT